MALQVVTVQLLWAPWCDLYCFWFGYLILCWFVYWHPHPADQWLLHHRRSVSQRTVINFIELFIVTGYWYFYFLPTVHMPMLNLLIHTFKNNRKLVAWVIFILNWSWMLHQLIFISLFWFALGSLRHVTSASVTWALDYMTVLFGLLSHASLFSSFLFCLGNLVTVWRSFTASGSCGR